MGRYRNLEKGAVSLFIVVFSALLITVVTISFIRIMIQDQQQATSADLSQSAYDSAQAGVEDAKRALLVYQRVCNSADASACAAIRDAMSASSGCNAGLIAAGIIAAEDSSDGNNREVLVQQTDENDKKLDQAYTCVKIILNTDEYLGSIAAGESKIIPLVGVDTSYDTIQIEWHSSDDIQDGTTTVDLPLVSDPLPLTSQAVWTTKQPALVRAQLMQYGDSFTLNDFDDSNAAGQSNANTLFLYPVRPATADYAAIDSTTKIAKQSLSYASDARKVASVQEPLPVTCQSNLNTGGYACAVTITLPTPVNAGTRTAFLRLTALYNKTSFSVKLLSGTRVVAFRAVQPKVDSTGRANDLFRRTDNRVELGDSSFPYPESAVDTTGNLCKNFTITDGTGPDGGYKNNCTP